MTSISTGRMFRAALLGISLLIFSAPMTTRDAHAGTVTVVGDPANGEQAGRGESDRGNFTADLTYTFDAGTSTGWLTVSITNTSVNPNSELTGFLFGSGNEPISDVTVTLENGRSYWEFASGTNIGPFGDFAYGASLPPNFQGGNGNSIQPADGANDFVFKVTGVGASGLTEIDFLSENAKGQVFVAKFKSLDEDRDGGEGEGSDVVPGLIVIIPVPAPLGLAAAGLVGVAFLRRRITRA